MDEMQAMAAIARIASAHASSDRTEAVTVGRVRDMLEAIEGGRARCDCVDLLKHKWWFNSSKLPSYLGGGSWNKKGGRATEHKSHGHNYRTWMPKVRRYGNAEDAGVHVEIDMDHMRTAQSDDHAFIDIIVTAPAGNPRDARITQAVASYGIGGEVKTIQVKPETLEQVVPGRAWEALVAGAAELVIGEFVGDGWSAGRIVFPHVIEQCLVSACACVYFHE
ncbi:MAG: hypothetical protein H6711_18510 [Myxococcales bacterium]|nr:hypothetical protein [Myxococcales bacterium]